jgi:hypothetical protein
VILVEVKRVAVSILAQVRHVGEHRKRGRLFAEGEVKGEVQGERYKVTGEEGGETQTLYLTL